MLIKHKIRGQKIGIKLSSLKLTIKNTKIENIYAPNSTSFVKALLLRKVLRSEDTVNALKAELQRGNM